MSFAAAHECKDVRRTCQICRARKARFQYRGQVRADRDHTLCFACFRSERERQRARRLAEIPAAAPLRAYAGKDAGLTGRQVEHRRRMLAHLAVLRASSEAAR